MVLGADSLPAIAGKPGPDSRLAGLDRFRIHATVGVDFPPAPTGRLRAPGARSRVLVGDDRPLRGPDGTLSARALDRGLDPDLLPLGTGAVCARRWPSSVAARGSAPPRHVASPLGWHCCPACGLGSCCIGRGLLDCLSPAPLVAGPTAGNPSAGIRCADRTICPSHHV